MIIKLLPQLRGGTLEVSRAGDILTVNGEPFDFSPMHDGGTLPRTAIYSEWFVGDIEKVEGELIVTLLLPIHLNYSPEQAFPTDLTNVPDGAVELPQPLPDLPVQVTDEEAQ